MAGRLDRDSEAGFPRASHQRGDLVGIARIGDRGGLLRHGEVPGSPCRVVAVITRRSGRRRRRDRGGGCGRGWGRRRRSSWAALFRARVAETLPRVVTALPGANPAPPRPTHASCASLVAVAQAPLRGWIGTDQSDVGSLCRSGPVVRPQGRNDECRGRGGAHRPSAARDGHDGSSCAPPACRGARSRRTCGRRLARAAARAASTSSACSPARSASSTAALLACGPRAVLSHWTSVFVFELCSRPARRGRRRSRGGLAGRRPGIRPHRARALPRCDVVVKHGLQGHDACPDAARPRRGGAARRRWNGSSRRRRSRSWSARAELLAMAERAPARRGVRVFARSSTSSMSRCSRARRRSGG